MRQGVALAAALGLVLGGCATLSERSAAAWSYKATDGTASADGPLALWGEPNTLAFHVLRCNVPASMLEFEDIEAEEFEGGRPIRLEAGGHSWSGEERMDPADAVPVSRTRLPLYHSVVTALGKGASLRVSRVSGSMELAVSGAVRRVVEDCRALAAR